MPVFKATMKSLKVVLLNISIYFVIFIVFGDMTAWGSSSSTETIFEETKLDVVIIDNDNSALSRGLTEYIDKTQDLKKAKTDDLRVINDNIRFNIYDYAIIIPSGFEEKVKNGEFKDAIEYISPGANSSEYLLTKKIDTYLNNIVIYLNSGYSKDEAVKLTNEKMLDLSNTSVTLADNKEEYHRSYFRGIFTFNGYSLLMMLAISISTCLLFMKEKDIRDRIAVSGMRFRKRNAGIIGAILLIGITLTGLTILAAVVLNRDTTYDKIALYSINTFTLMFIGLGLAYFISAITSDENIINMLSNMIVLSMCFLCGTFVDTQFMSPMILKLAQFLPLYWYNKAIVFINNTPASDIICTKFLTYLCIELLFALVFFAAGLVISKKKEQYAV